MSVGKRQRTSTGQRQRSQLTPSAPPCMGHGELRAEASRLVAREVREDELHFLYTTYRGMCERGAWLTVTLHHHAQLDLFYLQSTRRGDGGTEAEAEVQVAYTVPVSTAKGALTPARVQQLFALVPHPAQPLYLALVDANAFVTVSQVYCGLVPPTEPPDDLQDDEDEAVEMGTEGGEGAAATTTAEEEPSASVEHATMAEHESIHT